MKLDRTQIMEILPHRPPFLLIDEVVDYTPGESATALWHITGQEDFFKGHYPDYPVLPGVLIVEACAQTCGIAALVLERHEGRTPFFAGAKNIRWKSQVTPGGTLRLEAEITQLSFRGIKASCKAYFDDKTACECELVFVVG